MKKRILLFVIMCLALAATAVAAVDTLWIPATAGALEAAINSDTANGGLRAHPDRVYGLLKDQLYVQNAGIVFKGGGTLRIVGQKGGAYPIVQMVPVNGVDPGDLTSGIANKVQGSLLLDHVYWLGKTTVGTQYNNLFGLTTVNGLSQSCKVNDCITEFIGLDTFNGDGYTSGSTWKFTNCYFRALFNGGQWWAARVMYCKKPIDTIYVENCTVSNGGLTFLQQEAVTRFAFFNHNTFINNHKYWLLNPYYVNLYITNNFFSNQNWVGEDSMNVAIGGQDNDGRKDAPVYMGTISVDTITIKQQLFADMFNASDSTVIPSKVGFDVMKVYVSNNISWTDPLLNSYFTSHPVSKLDWGGRGTGPWEVVNQPGVWMNPRTSKLFTNRRTNIVQSHNDFTKHETVTPSIANAGIVTLMIAWNQKQWSDPAFPNATNDLVNSVYVPGDKDAGTLPGYTGGLKSENGLDAGIAKINDFIENYELVNPKPSFIDGLPVGALTWSNSPATVPASSWTAIQAQYLIDAAKPDGVAEAPGVAGTFKLNQNYPNPFNPSTQIEFTLPKASNVELKIFNLLGQEVATLVHSTLAAGQHSVPFDAKSLASGVYIYRLTAGANVDTKKMVLMK